MAASEIATVSGTIIQIAGVIQELGNNYYKASADWDDFPRKIARLQRKHDFWQKEFKRSDMLSDRPLMETLGEAERLLNDHKAILERREARCGAGCWSMGKRTVFPAQVGLRIQLVIDAFDSIPGFLQMEAEAIAALDARMMQRPPSLAFRDDDSYVPLEATESKVQIALDNSDGSPLVLLHGGAGKGKSTLARHVALHYQKGCKNPDRPFELVVFLDCGPKADVLTSQFKLAQLLGANTDATALPQEPGQTGSAAAIRRRLSGLLRHQRILIICDDVWERNFLQEMLNLCGVGVKFLVTSQHRDVCRGLSLTHPAIQIQIEDIKDDVAMKILASHVGFRDKKILAHIQKVAHKMLEGADGNPLALASVATAIDDNRSGELLVWEAASENFLKLLHSTDTAYTLGQVYSKSFWSATQLSMQSLNKGAQILLILLYMCEAPSLPEEVLRVLYTLAVIPGVFETFETSRLLLESRGLVKIISETLEDGNDRKLYSWTLHSLQKLFIEHEVSDEKGTVLKVCKDTVLKMLASQSYGTNFEANRARLETKSPTDISAEEDLVQVSLCSLYFHEQYLKTAFKMETRPAQLNSLRRNTIEPITRLLGLPVSERWTKAAQASAKQIYLTYIYNSSLHNNAILDLLAMPISVLPVLQAFEDIATIESERTLIDENSGALVKALLDFLGNASDADNSIIGMAASRVILQLSSNILHHQVIISCGMLDTIIKILSSDSPLVIQAASTNILVDLTYKDDESKLKIFQHPTMLQQLLQATSLDKSHDLKRVATEAIGNLTNMKSYVTKQQLMDFPGLLEQMVNLLRQENNLDLQAAAARALVNLTGLNNDITNRQLLNFPGFLEQMVNLLSVENSPDLQVLVANVLANMACSNVHHIIVNYSNAVEQLLASTSRNDNPKLQLMAARTLVNLTGSNNDILIQQLLNFPGFLEQMVKLLLEENSADLQVQAAQAFANLVGSHNDITARQVLNFPGLLEQMVNLLSDGDNLELQGAAAVVVCNLAQSQVDGMRLRMMHCSKLLDKFVNLLSNGQFHEETNWAHYIEALTSIDPSQGNGVRLHSALAYAQRGRANMMLDLNNDALDDLNRADEIEPGNDLTLRCRSTVRARLRDFEGALVDSNNIIEKHRTAFHLQERGVLKRMMEDLPGALADLNESLQLKPDDYEVLKHRGFVRFLMSDESGAHSDGQMALKVRPSIVDAHSYGRYCLGTTSIEFFDYKLR